METTVDFCYNCGQCKRTWCREVVVDMSDEEMSVLKAYLKGMPRGFSVEYNDNKQLIAVYCKECTNGDGKACIQL